MGCACRCLQRRGLRTESGAEVYGRTRAYCDTYTYCHADRHRYGHGNTDSHGYSYRYAYCHGNRNCYCHADGYCYAYRNGHTHCGNQRSRQGYRAVGYDRTRLACCVCGLE